jgi:hypothetical protein
MTLRRLSTWWCRFTGQHHKQWARLDDDTPIMGCIACKSYVRRETSDPRLRQPVQGLQAQPARQLKLVRSRRR